MVGNYSADEVSIANWNKTYADTLYSDSNETTNVSWMVDYITNQTTDDCPSGNYSYGVSANGSVLCRDDVDTDTTIGNETTNVSWMVDYITNQTTDDCPSGNYSYGTSVNGSHLCRDDETSDVTDSNETTNISWIVDYITNQTDDDCPTGTFVTGIGADGNVTCTADIDHNLTDGDIAGFGYIKTDTTIGNETTNVTWIVDYITNQTADDCPSGNYSYGVSVNGSVLCRDDIDTDTDTQLSGTDVIAMVGNYSTHVELDTNLTGTDVVAMVGNYSADEVSIANWNKTYADTLYSDSNETTNVSWMVDYITNQTADDCASGSFATGLFLNGSVVCTADTDSNLTGTDVIAMVGNYSADEVSIANWNKTYADTLYSDSNETTNVTWIVNYILNQTTNDCAAGNLVIGIETNGSVKCAVDDDTDSNLTEDNVEAYIFDSDNTAALDMNGYPIYGVIELNVTGDINITAHNLTSVDCILFANGGKICNV